MNCGREHEFTRGCYESTPDTNPGAVEQWMRAHGPDSGATGVGAPNLVALDFARQHDAEDRAILTSIEDWHRAATEYQRDVHALRDQATQMAAQALHALSVNGIRWDGWKRCVEWLTEYDPNNAELAAARKALEGR